MTTTTIKLKRDTHKRVRSLTDRLGCHSADEMVCVLLHAFASMPIEQKREALAAIRVKEVKE